jgi:hypothetical protein
LIICCYSQTDEEGEVPLDVLWATPMGKTTLLCSAGATLSILPFLYGELRVLAAYG